MQQLTRWEQILGKTVDPVKGVKRTYDDNYIAIWFTDGSYLILEGDSDREIEVCTDSEDSFEPWVSRDLGIIDEAEVERRRSARDAQEQARRRAQYEQLKREFEPETLPDGGTVTPQPQRYTTININGAELPVEIQAKD